MPATAALTGVICDVTVAAGAPWSRVIEAGQILRIVDLEGQQAVDFLCYAADDPADRYSATNTIKVQGNVYVGEGTVLYGDSGAALLRVVADTLGRHDTLYGCCSNANNHLRYGVTTTESCYTNFTNELASHGLDQRRDRRQRQLLHAGARAGGRQCRGRHRGFAARQLR